jgi:NDP-sugar pyrophosphorylase family protein
MVLMGDDIYEKEDLEALARHDWGILAWKEKDAGRKGGKIFLNPDGSIKEVVEDTKGELFSPLVNTGVAVLTKDVFSYPLVQIPGRNEYGLFMTMLQAKDRKIYPVEATFWKQITAPEDLLT